MRLGKLGFEAQGLAQLNDGFIQCPLALVKRHAQISMGFGIVRLEMDRFAELSDRAVPVAVTRQGRSQPYASLLKVRFQSNHFTILGNGSVRISFSLEQVS